MQDCRKETVCLQKRINDRATSILDGLQKRNGMSAEKELSLKRVEEWPCTDIAEKLKQARREAVMP